VKEYGWISDPDFDDMECLSAVSDIGADGAGGTVLLFSYLEKVLGKPYEPRDQGSTPSCVGQATACAIDHLVAIEQVGVGLDVEFVAPASAEALYAGSRYEIGYERYKNKRLLRSAGSHGSYCVEFARDYGILLHQDYGSVDLTHFDERRCVSWGRTGVPDELEPTALQKTLKDYTVCNSYEEIRGAIANGYPVIIGSSYGFKGQPKRDEHGMLKPKGTWRHEMVFTAYDEGTTHPSAVFCQNSWGDRWVGGPKRFENEPEGGFWIAPKVVDSMAKRGEAIALSGSRGFERRKLSYSLI
jgi:hypothetical protein